MLLVMRTTWEGPTGDPADRLVYSWGLDGPQPSGTILTLLARDVEDAFTQPGDLPASTVTTMRPNIQNPYVMLFHEIFDAGGGAALDVRDAINNPTTAGSGASGPTEVQVAITRLTSSARGPIATGRIYYGPFPAVANRIVPTLTQQNLVGHALSLHRRFVARGYVPQVIAKAGTLLVAGRPIIGYRVDQLWDTQRRRGQERPAPGTAITGLV